MRHIPRPKNSDAPAIFRDWLAKHPAAHYSRLGNSRIKSELKHSLVARQAYLCGYCECRIFDETSHIEHVEPQFGGVSDKTLTYSNMLASCIKDPKSGRGLPAFSAESAIHCGHARGTHEVVCPYDSDCEKYFEYSFSGEVRPNPKLADPRKRMLAVDSIGYLRLNVPSLVVGRKIAMTEAIRLFQAGVPREKILGKSDSKLLPFWSAAKFALDRLAAKRRPKTPRK